MAGEQTTSSTMVFGWFVLIGIAFLLNTLPLIIGLAALWYLIKLFPKPSESEQPTKTEEEIPSYTWDDTLTYEPIESVSEETISDAISALQNLGSRKGDAKVAVEMAVNNGAISLEEMVKQGLQNLNHK
jgi:hypothetical protein